MINLLAKGRVLVRADSPLGYLVGEPALALRARRSS